MAIAPINKLEYLQSRMKSLEDKINSELPLISKEMGGVVVIKFNPANAYDYSIKYHIMASKHEELKRGARHFLVVWCLCFYLRQVGYKVSQVRQSIAQTLGLSVSN